ncbi:MAG: rod shape-determining protein MreC [Ilumatobacteraceae bacterium]|nr:rod shape-determining protein MreC [Ilumatobacteraceae bacterium]
MGGLTRKRVIAILALTSILLITMDLRNSSSVSSIRRLFGAIFHPIEGATRVLTTPINNIWHGITDYGDVSQDNKRLKDLIARQEGATIANIAGVREAQELLALNGLPTLAGIDSCTGQVVGQSPSNFSQTVEINRGRRCGIRVGMPVLNAAGLIGKVTESLDDRAVVMLITDPAYSLSVKIVNQPPPIVTVPSKVPESPENQATTTTTSTTTTTTTIAPKSAIDGFTPGVTIATLPSASPNAPSSESTIAGDIRPGQGNVSQITVPPGANLPLRETGALEGRGLSRTPIVRFIENQPRFGAVYIGSPIVSSGGATSLAPPDIVVGTVSRIISRTGTLGPLLEVKVAANLESLNFVRVLLYQPTTERPSAP